MSALLAGAMVLSVSSTAFASTTNITTVDGMTEGQLIEVTGTTKTADIKITVPTSGSIVLNPYELNYDLPAGSNPATSTDQIISAKQYIHNESDLPVKVSGTVTGTAEGAEFVAGSAAAVTDKKAVNLKFTIGAVANDTAALPSTGAIELTTTAQDLPDTTLDKKNGTNTYVVFGFTGDASKNPTNAWTADDIVGATIAFTFALDNSGAGGGSNTGSVTITATDTALDSTTTTSTSATFSFPSSVTANGNVTWSSDTPSVATVTSASNDNNATITYQGTGTANISASFTGNDGKNYTGSIQINCT